MKVAVLGSSGGMGAFFVRYFISRGDSVRGHDKRQPPLGQLGGGFTFHSSNAQAVEGSDLVVVATPMDAVIEVTTEALRRMKEGAVLMEISSVKGKVLPEVLRMARRKKVRVLSIHPLFGPSIASTNAMKIAVVVASSKAATGDSELAKSYFPDARRFEIGLREHDRTMAVVLSLTHLVNFAYARTVSRYLSPDEFKRAATPNSSVQMTLAQAVLAQDPGLCFGIQVENENSEAVGRTLRKELDVLIDTLRKRDRRRFERYFSDLTKTYETRERGKEAVKEVYSAAGSR